MLPVLPPAMTHPPPPLAPPVVFSTPSSLTTSTTSSFKSGSSYQNASKLAHSIFQPRLNQKCCALISHVSFWPVFFIQVISDPLRRLSDVEKILLDRSNTMRINPILRSGSLVVANFKNDLYRGIVTNVDGDQERAENF